MTGPLTGLLLAAGRGTRFGGDKIRATLAHGGTVGLAAATPLVDVVDRLLVVVDADDAAAAMFRGAGFSVVVVPEALQGMGHSLAGGVRASADSGGWLVALADMPCIAPATTARVARALRDGADVAVPRYRGRPGHPVGFGAARAAELAALGGDRGARGIVAAAGDAVTWLDTDDAGCVLDIDTPADLAALAARGEP